MNIYAYLIICSAVFCGGFFAGKSYESLEVNALVQKAKDDSIAELKRINDDNKKLTETVANLDGVKTGLEQQLKDALATVKVRVETRTEWREREAQNPTCAAWLAAPVPCQLRPDDTDHSRTAGPGTGSTP